MMLDPARSKKTQVWLKIVEPEAYWFAFVRAASSTASAEIMSIMAGVYQ